MLYSLVIGVDTASNRHMGDIERAEKMIRLKKELSLKILTLKSVSKSAYESGQRETRSEGISAVCRVR